jgi:O-antigen/teichoic acid export membrane protein
VSSSAIPVQRRAPLPEGTLPVAVSLLIAGVATFAFFRVGQSALGGDDGFQPIQSMWFATFALAPGFFLPLEQELGRALAHRRARDEGGRPVAAKVIRLGVGITLAVLVAMAVFSPLIADELFRGDWWMLLALATAFAAYAPAHLARGICSGSGRFREYALVIGADGVIRIAVCLLFAAVGLTSPVPYAFAVALSPLVAVTALGARGSLASDPGPEAEWSEVTQNLGWLLVGAVFAGALLNAGPLAAAVLGTKADSDRIAQFGYGVLLARIPLFMFQAVQAALLPRLARLAARGEFVEFVAGFRRLMVLVGAIGAIGTLGALVLGSPILELVFDAELTGRTMAMLALSSAIYMAAIATAQAVVALRGHALVAVGWAGALVTFFVATWLSSDMLFRRIEIGLVASSMAGLFCFAIALRSRLTSGFTDSPTDVGPIPELPLEP